MQGQKINSRRPVSSFLYLLGLLCTYLSVWWQLLCEGAFSNYTPVILVIPSSTLQDFKVCLVLYTLRHAVCVMYHVTAGQCSAVSMQSVCKVAG